MVANGPIVIAVASVFATVLTAIIAFYVLED